MLFFHSCLMSVFVIGIGRRSKPISGVSGASCLHSCRCIRCTPASDQSMARLRQQCAALVYSRIHTQLIACNASGRSGAARDVLTSEYPFEVRKASSIQRFGCA